MRRFASDSAKDAAPAREFVFGGGHAAKKVYEKRKPRLDEMSKHVNHSERTATSGDAAMLFARFIDDRRASAVPIFALAVIPVLAMTGAAVDYSRANSVRAAMQAALDAAALNVSRDAQTLSAAQITQKATDYFNANFHRSEASNVQVTASFTSPQQGSFKLSVSASATVNPMFM